MEWDKKEITRVMDRSRWLKEQPPERMRLQMVQRVLKSHRKYKKSKLENLNWTNEKKT